MEAKPTFTDRLIEAIRQKRSLLCVGLDPQLRYIPPDMRAAAVARYRQAFEAIGRLYAQFNREVIDAVEPFVIAVKPQMAFYEAYGQWGLWAFAEIVQYARSKGLIVIEDAKRGDGGDTAEAYADGHLGEVSVLGSNGVELTKAESPIRVDAMTVQGWIGSACVEPFVARVKQYGTGVFIVDKTSFRPNSEVEQIVTRDGLTNWQALAHLVSKWGKGTEGSYGYRNIGVVMGATYPTDAPTMRWILPNAWFLVPGYGGPQDGGADGAVVGVNSDGLGCVVNSSRGVIFAWHPVSKSRFQGPPENYRESAAQAAEFARDELNAALQRSGKLNF